MNSVFIIELNVQPQFQRKFSENAILMRTISFIKIEGVQETLASSNGVESYSDFKCDRVHGYVHKIYLIQVR